MLFSISVSYNHRLSALHRSASGGAFLEVVRSRCVDPRQSGAWIIHGLANRHSVVEVTDSLLSEGVAKWLNSAAVKCLCRTGQPRSGVLSIVSRLGRPGPRSGYLITLQIDFGHKR